MAGHFKFKGKTDHTPCKCLMDTCTACNIISINNLNKLIPDAKLWPINTKHHFYDGSHMKPMGVYSMYSKHKDKQLKLRFEIVTTRVTRQQLLSKNTCEKLGLVTIHNQRLQVPTARGTSPIQMLQRIHFASPTDPIHCEWK